MVFYNKVWNNTGDIVVYSNYHRYWTDRERKERNPYFDVFSGKILDLKNKQESAIDYFYNLLDCEICKDVTICVVPSSNADNLDSGIARLGEKLARNGRRDKVHFLVRKNSINKLAHGGNRSKYVHLNSIETMQGISVEGDIVLLMDDVTTTGNSLYTCKDILMSHGAQNVEMFALGKAV